MCNKPNVRHYIIGCTETTFSFWKTWNCRGPLSPVDYFEERMRTRTAFILEGVHSEYIFHCQRRIMSHTNVRTTSSGFTEQRKLTYCTSVWPKMRLISQTAGDVELSKFDSNSSQTKWGLLLAGRCVTCVLDETRNKRCLSLERKKLEIELWSPALSACYRVTVQPWLLFANDADIKVKICPYLTCLLLAAS